MPRPDALYLQDILDAANRIERFLAGQSLSDFVDDEIRRHAVLMNLVIIGEAAGSVTDSFKAAHGDIGWRAIVRFRNRVVHGYFNLDWSIVWTAATQDVPTLLADLRALLNPDD